MDIGPLRNNHTYYDGFEDEEEVEITLVKDQSINIHFWVGYMDDILCNPDLSSIAPPQKGTSQMMNK